MNYKNKNLLSNNYCFIIITLCKLYINKTITESADETFYLINDYYYSKHNKNK